MSEKERWLPVVGYEGWYSVSNHGHLRRERAGQGAVAGKLLKPLKNSYGYPQASLWKEGISRKCFFHRLVMAAFVGPCPDGKEVNHKDGIKSNCRVENLEYVTRSENNLHAHRTGLVSCRGSNNGRSKLTEKDVHIIRSLLGHETRAAIAELFGVHRITINGIARGTTWGWLEEAK